MRRYRYASMIFVDTITVAMAYMYDKNFTNETGKYVIVQLTSSDGIGASKLALAFNSSENPMQSLISLINAKWPDPYVRFPKVSIAMGTRMLKTLK